MKLDITKRNCVELLVVALGLLAAGVVGQWLVGEAALLVLLIVSVVLVLALLLHVYHRLSDQHEGYQATVQRGREYQQIESLFSLFFTLKPDLPLPEMRQHWAASPDLLRRITEIILLEKPELVLEAGSGVSTLIIAYCLKRLGKGRVISLEHDAQYAATTKRLIANHGLDSIASVIHAPLREVSIDDKKWLWYNMDGLKTDQPIDMLVVDGPPEGIQELSRYPALPLLSRQLNDSWTLILDDGNRTDEKKIVALWEQEFDHITTEFFETEKGTFIVRGNEPTRSS